MFHDGFMGGGIIFTWIFWFSILVVIVYSVIKLTNNNRDLQNHNTDTPLEFLKKRYAKGEISREEFINMKRDLD